MTTEDKLRRQIVWRMQTTGLHYHGDFRKVKEVLNDTAEKDLIAVLDFLDRIMLVEAPVVGKDLARGAA